MSGRIFSSFKWKTRSGSWWCKEVLCNIQTCTSRSMLFCGLRHCLLDLQAGLQAHLTHLSAGFGKVKIGCFAPDEDKRKHCGPSGTIELLTVDFQFRLESEAARRQHETTEVVKRRAHGLGVCVAQACPLQMNKMQTFSSTFVNLWIGCCYAMAKQIIDTDFIEQKSTLKGLLWWQLVRMTAKLNLLGSQG